jgi:hypothetical protein
MISAPILLAVIAVAGCGSSAAEDPLTGTWSNTTCYGTTSTPADISSCTVALTFTAGLDISLQATWLSMPATATHPGCTTTELVTGQTWSTMSGDNDMQVFTVSGAGTSTTARTGCVNMTDDLMPTPTTDISITEGDTDYQLSSGSLTVLAGPLAGTYQN